MNIITDSTYARDCFNAANVAARIHYTTHEDVDNCTLALNFNDLSVQDRAATYTNRGIIHMALEEYEKAVSDYSSALSLEPEIAEIYVNIGNVYYMGKVYDKAIVEYTKAIDMRTSSIHVAYTNRGMSYESLGDLDNAEQDYLTALEILPDSTFLQDKLNQLREE
jgi:tetratricopeptide (TPR) repeat protein